MGYWVQIANLQHMYYIFMLRIALPRTARTVIERRLENIGTPILMPGKCGSLAVFSNLGRNFEGTIGERRNTVND